jgi:hypothetical protein
MLESIRLAQPVISGPLFCSTFGSLMAIGAEYPSRGILHFLDGSASRVRETGNCNTRDRKEHSSPYRRGARLQDHEGPAVAATATAQTRNRPRAIASPRVFGATRTRLPRPAGWMCGRPPDSKCPGAHAGASPGRGAVACTRACSDSPGLRGSAATHDRAPADARKAAARARAQCVPRVLDRPERTGAGR